MFDRIQHFVFAADEGTFTLAARRAHITQPALTASIQKLEAVVGAPLLLRGPNRRVELTPAGEAYLPRARAALAALEDGARAVRELLGLERGVVRIGAGATVCTYYLPPLLAQFRKMFPRIELHLREAVTDEVTRALDAGQLDLGIVALSGTSQALPPTFQIEPWLEDELILVTSPKGPYPRRGLDLSRAPFVTFPRGATTREILERQFPGATIAMELSGIAAIKSNVRAGIGVALVSRRAVARDLRARTLQRVTHPATPIIRRFSLVHRGAPRLPPAAAALHELIGRP
jgi:DNA-binding transcriptional LysR family regulator